jgi:hypothetical protein
MRKWFAWLLFPVLGLAAVYFFIPNTITIKKQLPVSTPASAFERAFFNLQTWRRWWPGDTANQQLSYNGNRYSIREQKHHSLVVTVSNQDDSLRSELVFIPLQSDSIVVTWLGAVNTGLQPFARWQKRNWARETAADMEVLLQKMQFYFANKKQLYGLTISETAVVDSNLISTAVRLHHYPTPNDIYTLVDKLQAHIQKNSGRQTGLPMLNITANADSSYLARVALPVDQKLPDAGDIQYRWMLGGGNILVTEVKGGPYRIEQAFTEMQKYLEDHRRLAPAIPFQSLVTDRRAEPDTAKWVTRLYWPVM